MLSVAFVIAFVTGAFAQVPVYGQCGGQGWTGATTCVSGSVCTFDNPYYSQCVPGSATTVTTTFTTNPVTTTPVTSTTVKSTSSAPTSTAGVTYFFMFGDSYSANGFTYTGTKPTIGNPLGNPPPPGQLWTNGLNWVEALTIKSNRSILLTSDFAVGGADIDASIIAGWQPTNMNVQIEQQFIPNVPQGTSWAPWNGANSLFGMFIGINDIWDSFDVAADANNQTAIHTALISRYIQLAGELYTAGARRFLFVNVPTVEKTPYSLALNTSEQAFQKTQIADYNSKLASAVTSFQSSHSGSTTYLYDSYSFFTKIIANYQSYGFTDVTTTCATCLWYDDYHPKTTMHQLMATDISSFLQTKGFW